MRYFGLDSYEFSNQIMDTMRCAMKEIRARRAKMKVHDKGTTPSGSMDLVTDADFAAQEIYANAFRLHFPGVGLIGEENGLMEACTADENIILTIDPLDGTKAFVRGQSHGVGSMVGVLIDGKLAGGFVGDVMTGEIYAAEPGLTSASHYERDGSRRELRSNSATSLSDQYILFRKQPVACGEMCVEFARSGSLNRLFKDYLIDSGSIGLHFARLWKGEIGGFVIEASYVTPWDHNPCFAISQRLGIAQIAIDQILLPVAYAPVERVTDEPRTILYLPKESQSQLLKWHASYAMHLPETI